MITIQDALDKSDACARTAWALKGAHRAASKMWADATKCYGLIAYIRYPYSKGTP